MLLVLLAVQNTARLFTTAAVDGGGATLSCRRGLTMVTQALRPNLHLRSLSVGTSPLSPTLPPHRVQP